MVSTTLHLAVHKGTRTGETLECHPGALIHIGRIIRGNTLVIRDPGISQKHLCLQFDHNSARWTVSDLDSSNGTLLNGVPVSPSAPVPLSHGDSIKIGESTSISIQILDFEPSPPRTRASSRKDSVLGPSELPVRTRAGSKKKEEVLEPKKVGRGRRARVRKEEEQEAEPVVVEVDSVPVDGNGGKEKVAEGEVEDEMEKMTLGEWFNRMEKYLPQVINETAEEIIAGLRGKARMFNEFVTTHGTNV